MLSKKRALFLVGSFIKNTSANGVCCKKLAKEYVKNGYEVHCVCFGAYDNDEKEINTDDIIVHQVKMPYKYKLNEKYNNTGKTIYHKISRAITAINYWHYPFLNLSLLNNYCNKVDEIFGSMSFDVVISVYHPIEALYSVYKHKKKNNNFYWVIYSLDTLSNFENSKNPFSILKKRINMKFEKKFFTYADLIVNMRSHEAHYENSIYKDYKNKMVISDIPLLDELDSLQKNKILEKKNDDIEIVYGGSLNSKMRNPTYICEFFSSLSKFINLKVLFYSTGNCLDIIKKYEDSTNGLISLNRLVSHSEMIEIIKNSDYVISMENKNSFMIPSKIFEYFSYNKRIIHFYSSKNDPTIFYFSKYPNVLLLNTNDELNNNIDKFIAFSKTKIKRVENLQQIYNMNTIKYTFDLINNHNNKNNIK